MYMYPCIYISFSSFKKKNKEKEKKKNRNAEQVHSPYVGLIRTRVSTLTRNFGGRDTFFDAACIVLMLKTITSPGDTAAGITHGSFQ